MQHGRYVFFKPHTLRNVIGWILHTTAQSLTQKQPKHSK